MEQKLFTAKVIWSQIDANNHLRHSAYADLACQARIDILESLGITNEKMMELGIGPIITEERTTYKREVPPNTTVTINCKLASSREDGARYSFVQETFREDGILAAILVITGAWINLKARRLCIPPPEFTATLLENMERTADCEIYKKK